MTVLIDSNVLIDYLDGKGEAMDHVQSLVNRRIPLFISTISIYEVYLGIVANKYLKGGRPAKVPALLENYEKFLLKCGILDFNKDAAEKASDIFAQSQGKGMSIKQRDCQIAGIALAFGITEVLTRDKTDFERIRDLTDLPFTSY